MVTPSVIRVAVVDDYEIVVAGVAAVLSPFRDEVAVVELDSNLPVVSEVDVVLYDSFGQVQGPDIDLEELTASGTAKVVVFSWNTSADVVRRSLAAGVAGYVSKGVSGEGLVDALRRVHAGEKVTPEGLEQAEGDGFGAWPGQELGLSGREAEVLALICQGLSNEQIAAHAYIGLNTVKTYIRTLYRKIEVDSRTKAVLWGLDHGFRPDRIRSVE